MELKRQTHRGGRAIGPDHNGRIDSELAVGGFIVDRERSRTQVVAGTAVLKVHCRVWFACERIKQLRIQPAAADGVNHLVRLAAVGDERELLPLTG